MLWSKLYSGFSDELSREEPQATKLDESPSLSGSSRGGGRILKTFRSLMREASPKPIAFTEVLGGLRLLGYPRNNVNTMNHQVPVFPSVFIACSSELTVSGAVSCRTSGCGKAQADFPTTTLCTRTGQMPSHTEPTNPTEC